MLGLSYGHVNHFGAMHRIYGRISLVGAFIMRTVIKSLTLIIFAALALMNGHFISPALADDTGTPHTHNDMPEQSNTAQRREARKQQRSEAIKKSIENRRESLQRNAAQDTRSNSDNAHFIYRRKNGNTVGKKLWNSVR